MRDALDRRDFLRRLAAGAAYAAPVITSFAAPAAAQGQGNSSRMETMGHGHAGGAASPVASPWSANPPPGGQPPGGSGDSLRVP